MTDPAGLSDSAVAVITVTESQVETFEDEGTVSCSITGNCDPPEDVSFEVKPDAALVRVEWNLSETGILNANVAITIYNATGDEVYNITGQGEGEYSTEFSGADLQSIGDWKWEIEAEQGSMNWEVTIRVGY